MNKATLIKKVLAVGVCTAIGFGGLMASGEATPTAQAASASTTGQRIVSLGKNYLGIPYKFGASTSTTRVFDCSSFTKYIYGKYGVSLPRTSVAQSKVGRAVSKSNLRAGDLVFFSSGSRANGRNVTHVAVYAGSGKILHTYGSPGVTISDLNSGNWKRTYLKARRVL
ncbi:cell wall-associated NlpC family hydrolase [Paenibacillus forsythiae]|uniref:Cell wall-associated NlpC family hydrolase n=1 Tax=Paenibacillus forsythiae TaxID=365616 RepID=A0ABU3H1K1_9BACL|nr:C40 family peptidase [Paenibacillus forsythiae]MDT3424687.1 cell wall-associated NlpC family hydrolase [Paenibacillus forsythiae]